MQSVKAEVCHTHYGHQTRLGHIRLGAQDRLQIAGKLAQGVTLDKVLDEVRSLVSDNFKRVHLLQRKDIPNIERISNWMEVRGTMMMPAVLRHGWRR